MINKNDYNYGGIEEDLSLGSIFIFWLVGMLLIVGAMFLSSTLF